MPATRSCESVRELQQDTRKSNTAECSCVHDSVAPLSPMVRAGRTGAGPTLSCKQAILCAQDLLFDLARRRTCSSPHPSVCWPSTVGAVTSVAHISLTISSKSRWLHRVIQHPGSASHERSRSGQGRCRLPQSPVCIARIPTHSWSSPCCTGRMHQRKRSGPPVFRAPNGPDPSVRSSSHRRTRGARAFDFPRTSTHVITTRGQLVPVTASGYRGLSSKER